MSSPIKSSLKLQKIDENQENLISESEIKYTKNDQNSNSAVDSVAKKLDETEISILKEKSVTFSNEVKVRLILPVNTFNCKKEFLEDENQLLYEEEQVDITWRLDSEATSHWISSSDLIPRVTRDAVPSMYSRKAIVRQFDSSIASDSDNSLAQICIKKSGHFLQLCLNGFRNFLSLVNLKQDESDLRF